jgi:DNA-binding transcriptional LysR family regulator
MRSLGPVRHFRCTSAIRTHNLKVIGSNPIPATRQQAIENASFSRAFCCREFDRQCKAASFVTQLDAESSVACHPAPWAALGLGAYGIDFLPDWSVQEQLTTRSLRRLNIRGRRLKQEFRLVYRRQRMSPAARAFIEFCKRNKQLLPETARAAGL